MSTERINELLHLFNQVAPIARTFGMALSYTDEGHAVVDLPYNPGLDHPLGGKRSSRTLDADSSVSRRCDIPASSENGCLEKSSTLMHRCRAAMPLPPKNCAIDPPPAPLPSRRYPTKGPPTEDCACNAQP